MRIASQLSLLFASKGKIARYHRNTTKKKRKKRKGKKARTHKQNNCSDCSPVEKKDEGLGGVTDRKERSIIKHVLILVRNTA
jgi:hypothetical protein